MLREQNNNYKSMSAGLIKRKSNFAVPALFSCERHLLNGPDGKKTRIACKKYSKALVILNAEGWLV
jgi:hypothetical protein